MSSIDMGKVHYEAGMIFDDIIYTVINEYKDTPDDIENKVKRVGEMVSEPDPKVSRWINGAVNDISPHVNLSKKQVEEYKDAIYKRIIELESYGENWKRRIAR